jgi:hypothetical protein
LRLSPIFAIAALATVLGTLPAAAEPMTFDIAGGPSCEGCATVFASGDIDIDTADRLAAEASRRGLGRGTVLVLDSPGGRLLGGLRLGRAIRRFGFDTRIGRLDERGRPSDGICASACALAFLGGSRRDVSPGSRFGVHRFYFPEGSRTFDEDELGRLQELTGQLVNYATNMGVDARLVSLSSSKADLKVLTPEELRRFRVVWNPRTFSPWEVRTFMGGLAAVSHSADGSADLSLLCDETGTRRAVLVHRFEPPLTPRERDLYRRWFAQGRSVELFGREIGLKGADFAAEVDEIYLGLRLPRDFRPRPGAPARLADATSGGRVDYMVGTDNLEPASEAAFRNCVVR